MHNREHVERLKEELGKRYPVDPALVRVVCSPYRICPLGAHIDHQLGPVTAMAIDRGVLVAYAPSGGPRVQLSSLMFPGVVSFDLAAVPPRQADDWGNYPRGAAAALQQHYPLASGIVGVTGGDPVEGGLSSSAAVGVAYLLALEEVNGLQVSPRENIALDQAIENGYLGLRNGILDQSAILLSRRDHLTLIDCARADHALIPRPPAMLPFAVLVAFSGLRQALVNTDYNRRVEECNQAAAALLQACGRPQVAPLLGHVRPEEYAEYRHRISGAPARRAAHFFGEVDRVERGVAAWKEGDLAGFGRLMTESGRSSIEKYECGCEPLVDLYHILARARGVYGARFSGAGFRGCCVALADPVGVAQIIPGIQREYASRHPDLAARAPVLQCQPDDGARFLTDS
jgi:galacturonokinase